jgi:hypothetical protein
MRHTEEGLLQLPLRFFRLFDHKSERFQDRTVCLCSSSQQIDSKQAPLLA